MVRSAKLDRIERMPGVCINPSSRKRSKSLRSAATTRKSTSRVPVLASVALQGSDDLTVDAIHFPYSFPVFWGYHPKVTRN